MCLLGILFFIGFFTVVGLLFLDVERVYKERSKKLKSKQVQDRGL